MIVGICVAALSRSRNPHSNPNAACDCRMRHSDTCCATVPAPTSCARQRCGQPKNYSWKRHALGWVPPDSKLSWRFIQAGRCGPRGRGTVPVLGAMGDRGVFERSGCRLVWRNVSK